MAHEVGTQNQARTGLPGVAVHQYRLVMGEVDVDGVQDVVNDGVQVEVGRIIEQVDQAPVGLRDGALWAAQADDMGPDRPCRDPCKVGQPQPGQHLLGGNRRQRGRGWRGLLVVEVDGQILQFGVSVGGVVSGQVAVDGVGPPRRDGLDAQGGAGLGLRVPVGLFASRYPIAGNH